jgi:hypothetical protein
MRHIKHIHILLASLLMASVTFAQTRDGQAPDNAPAENAVSAARSRYIQTADTAPDVDNTTLAQLHRGGPARPFPPQRGYPRGTYQTPWMHHSGAGPILIGAAIGFGAGAALGASRSAHNGTPVGGGIIVGGGLFGLLGGCVGKAVGDFHALHYSYVHRRGTDRPSLPGNRPDDQPEDDEQSDLRPHSNAKEDRPEAAARPALLPQPAGVEAMAAASPIPAVPWRQEP